MGAAAKHALTKLQSAEIVHTIRAVNHVNLCRRHPTRVVDTAAFKIGVVIFDDQVGQRCVPSVDHPTVGARPRIGCATQR